MQALLAILAGVDAKPPGTIALGGTADELEAMPEIIRGAAADVNDPVLINAVELAWRRLRSSARWRVR